MLKKVFALILLIAPASAIAQVAPQKSSQAGVTVAVTPIEFAGAAKVWSFKIVLDTHSQDLSDDLAANAILLDGQGREHKPTAWEGAPPGGHHREGVLRFAPFEPAPDSVELRLLRPGEGAPRVFRWQLKP